MTKKMDADLWQARAALCELLALSFRYPDATLAEVVCDGEWVDAADEIAAATGVDWSVDPDLPFGSQDADEMLHSLRAEATRLFIGAPEPVISPFEGIWRAADDGVDALLFVNPHSMEVERFCKACGLGRPEGTNEPLDHVATELELLEYLAARAAADAAGDADAAVDADAESAAMMVASVDLPGGSAEAAFDQFMTSHVQLWMPRFAAKVQEESKLAFFAEAARLLECSLETMI